MFSASTEREHQPKIVSLYIDEIMFYFSFLTEKDENLLYN